MLSNASLETAGNPTSALYSILQYAATSINTVVPAAQAQATSQLYSQLSNPHCQLPPAPPSAGGDKNQPARIRMPENTATVKHNHQDPLRPNISSTVKRSPAAAPALGPRPAPRIATQRPQPTRTAEQELKARSFGFPPLPGKRMVMKRLKQA